MGQSLRLKPPHLAGAGSVPVWALPTNDNSHGWVLGKTFCIVGIIVAGQTAVGGLAEQRDQVMADVAAGTAFLEIVGGDEGKIQRVIQFSEGKESGVGGDGGTMELQPDLGIELDPERVLFAVTRWVPPMPVRK